MAKESLRYIDSRIVFKETFQSEQNTRRLGGIPSSIDYFDGIGGLNGTSGKLAYPQLSADTYSIRIKFNELVVTSAVQVILDIDNISSPSGFIYINATSGIISKPSGILYINGQTGTIVNSNTKELIVSGMSIIPTTDTFYIGVRGDGVQWWLNANIELVEIYKGTLTAEEVSNLYENKTYHELPDIIDENTYKILDVASFGGVLEDKMGNTLTPIDIEIKKVGSNIWSPDFNSGTSEIDVGNLDVLGDITILQWIKHRSKGSTNPTVGGRLLDNAKLLLGVNITAAAPNNSYFLTRNSSDLAVSGINSYEDNKWICIAVTTTSTGVTNIYINTVLSGVADQDGGTPEAGTTNLIIGAAAGTVAFTTNGKIPRTIIYKNILSLAQITQFFSNTRKDYNV